MGLALPLVPALPHDLAVPDDHCADDGVRVGRSAPALGQLERPLQAHWRACTSCVVGARDVVLAEDARARDKQVGACLAHVANVVRPDAAVDLDVELVAQELPQLRDPAGSPRA